MLTKDTHFAHMIDKNIKKGGPPTYQEPVRHKSFEFVKDFGVAVDIGANVGYGVETLHADLHM